MFLFFLGLCALASPGRIDLDDGWLVQSSAKVGTDGAALSAGPVDAENWVAASVPATVGAVLVAAGELPEPAVGRNLQAWPGMGNGDIRKRKMPEDSPFARSWWYRTTFEVKDLDGRHHLRLDGVNHRANAWLNGHQVASADEVEGVFRTFEIEVTGQLEAENTLAVEVFAAEHDDLGLTWLDWNPTPPDRNMGLHGAVWIQRSGAIRLVDPWVETKLTPAGAELTVRVDLEKGTASPESGVLSMRIQPPDGEPISLSTDVAIGPGGASIALDSDEHPELSLTSPELWWPAGMGDPALYDLELELSIDGAVSDRHEQRFGVREITSELSGEGHRRFLVNGEPILIRGAGWASDILLRRPEGRDDAQLDYVRDLGLNTVRLEGMVEPESFHRRCDALGILVMAGWSCCDRWEKTAKWSDEELTLAVDSLRDRIRVLRPHPSSLVWLYGSDRLPVERVERAYVDTLAELSWPNPGLAVAAAVDSPISGASGVKMNGPYASVSPSYWLTDMQKGGAFGFATEVGIGPAIPTLEGIRAMKPEGDTWPIDDTWRYHAGNRLFSHLDRLDAVISGRYGKADSEEDWLRKAHLVAYEGHRALFEGYRANKYAPATGVVQWMLNSAWHSLQWNLYDWDLRPGPAYFGAKKANQPVHVMFRYDDRSAVVVNATREAEDLDVRARVIGLDGNEVWSERAEVRVGADGVSRALEIPAQDGPHLVRLEVFERTRIVETNDYWLGRELDTIDFSHRDPGSEWFHTPTSQYADLKALADLPPASVSAVMTPLRDDSWSVNISNGDTLALLVRLTARRGGEELLPILWSDNFITLLPGESRTVRMASQALEAGVAPEIQIEGFNLTRSAATPLKLTGLEAVEAGKPTVVTFVASWSAPAKLALRHLVDLHGTSGEEVEFAAIGLDDPRTRAQLKALSRKLDLPFPLVFDSDLAISNVYNASRIIPLTLVFDEEGALVWKLASFRPGDEQRIADVLGSLR